MSGKVIVDQREYPLGSVRTADVGLEISHGALSVAGNAEKFCTARFEYSHPELRPIDAYDQVGDEAELKIIEPDTSGLVNTRNHWAIALNNSVDIGLTIASQSGSVALNLDELQLTDLDIQSQSGSVAASLAGDYRSLGHVALDSSSGKIEASFAGKFPRLKEIEFVTRSGSSSIAATGEFPELRRIGINSKSGRVDLDLNGSFSRDDLGVRVECVSGSVRIRIPGGVGASLNATTVSGMVRAPDFSVRRHGERQTNQYFGKTSATMWLNIHVVSGNVSVVSD